mmetsp:Transcript_77909/g.220326  ORF Transcript_77909/g.220326 Transcript_77909/m.220326 type:complete len:236 (+) Transcript_77909:26-733(+)
MATVVESQAPDVKVTEAGKDVAIKPKEAHRAVKRECGERPVVEGKDMETLREIDKIDFVMLTESEPKLPVLKRHCKEKDKYAAYIDFASCEAIVLQNIKNSWNNFDWRANDVAKLTGCSRQYRAQTMECGEEVAGIPKPEPEERISLSDVMDMLKTFSDGFPARIKNSFPPFSMVDGFCSGNREPTPGNQHLIDIIAYMSCKACVDYKGEEDCEEQMDKLIPGCWKGKRSGKLTH